MVATVLVLFYEAYDESLPICVKNKFPKESLLQDADGQRIPPAAIPFGDELGEPIVGRLYHVLFSGHLEHLLGLSADRQHPASTA